MAEDKSNGGVFAEALEINKDTVEERVTKIFPKLALDPSETDYRHGVAVLTYLRTT